MIFFFCDIFHLQASERHQYDAPVCSLVLKQIRHIETALFPDLVLPPSSDSADGGGAAGDSLSGTGEEVYLPSMARGHGGGHVGGLGGGRAGGPYSPSQSAALRKTVAGAAAGSGGIGGGGVGASIITYNNTDHMAQLMTALLDVEVASGKGHSSVSVVYGHPTLGEWWFWLSRLFAALASVVLVIFLFLHDY